MMRSIGAVVAGMLVIIAGSTLVDQALHAAGIYQEGQPLDDKLALLATSYRFLITVGGAWLTARLAPQRPMTHALILGLVGTILGLLGVVATWNAGLGPGWYPIALALLAIPQCWLGGRILEMQSRSRT